MMSWASLSRPFSIKMYVYVNIRSLFMTQPDITGCEHDKLFVLE